MIKLYDYELSGNCYKLRLMMGILGVDYEKVQIDFFPGLEHKSDWFLRINPIGQLPVLEDNGTLLRDAQAILIYLAAKYDKENTWYPTDNPELLGEISQWMSFADGITSTASAARLHDGLFYDFDIDACRDGAHRLFRIMDEHLWFAEYNGQDWLCSASHPTLADIACFPYVMLAAEGGISLQDYPAIRRWTDRVKRVPGFSTMSGIFPGAPAHNAA